MKKYCSSWLNFIQDSTPSTRLTIYKLNISCDGLLLFCLRSYRNNISFIINNKVIWILSDHTDKIYLPSSCCFCWCCCYYDYYHHCFSSSSLLTHPHKHISSPITPYIATECKKCEPKFNRQFHYLPLPFLFHEREINRNHKNDEVAQQCHHHHHHRCCCQKNAAIWITRNRNVISNK